MRRVLHVTTRFILGGAEKNLERVIEWEQSHGHHVALAVGRDSDPAALPRGVEVHVVEALQRNVAPMRDARAFAQLRRLVRIGRFDTVHTHESKAGIVGRVAARGSARTIAHTVHMASFGPAYSPVASQAFKLAERVCGRFTDAYATVGQELAATYIANGIGDAARFRTIRSPIGVDRFGSVRSFSDDHRRALRKNFGLSADLATVVVMGRLEPRKRHSLIVEQLATLVRTGELQLLIAGQGPEAGTLRALASDLGIADRVALVGHVAEAEQVFGAGTLLVHAATVEGVSQVVLQALAAGLPVVATDVEGLREVAGAPVTIAPRSGANLAEGVASLVRGPLPPPVPLSDLDEWQPDSIERQIASFHELLGADAPLAQAAGSP